MPVDIYKELMVRITELSATKLQNMRKISLNLKKLWDEKLGSFFSVHGVLYYSTVIVPFIALTSF